MRNALSLYTDGGARGNPGPGAIGIVIVKGNRIVVEYKEKIGRSTNNQAEYKALIKGLELAAAYAREVRCFLDSQLTVRQVTGKYKVKNKTLQELFSQLKEREKHFKKIMYTHLRRTHPLIQKADQLVNEALDEK